MLTATVTLVGGLVTDESTITIDGKTRLLTEAAGEGASAIAPRRIWQAAKNMGYRADGYYDSLWTSEDRTRCEFDVIPEAELPAPHRS